MPTRRAEERRLDEVLKAAVEVWKTEDDALDFLTRKHLMPGARTPKDVAQESDAGCECVKEIIGRVKHGTGI